MWAFPNVNASVLFYNYWLSSKITKRYFTSRQSQLLMQSAVKASILLQKDIVITTATDQCQALAFEFDAKYAVDITYGLYCNTQN